MISIIVAVGKNRVIGKRGGLPWYLPADLKHFKEITMGHPIVMGRRTHESIGKALPGRTNVVITREKNYEAPGCVIVHSIDEALDRVKGEEEIFFIGGAEIFSQALPLAKRLYITQIDHEFEGDIFFPEINMSEWREMNREEGKTDEKNSYLYRFLVFERKGV
ncbi:MAG: dihydrofolate reductase [Candidatus Liptonbacteria bacterium]|nr:dihydrofolate reductase [Candidatus Liptonbacteria bacterium]